MNITKTLNEIAGKFVVLESDNRILKNRLEKKEMEIRNLEKEIKILSQ
tara:strand:- start:1696 stop:1839 length:144 start_codon:yes stop_codon:yes gene_type:complete